MIQPRWFRLTPGRFVIGLLAVEGLLWLSNWLGWPAWHKGYAVLTAVATVGVAMLMMLVWFLAALFFRLRFQFSTRSLMLMVVVVALPCSWMAVEMRKAREQEQARKHVFGDGGIVWYDWDTTEVQEDCGPTWLRTLLGRDFFDIPVGASVKSNNAMQHLCQLAQLQELDLDGAQVTDQGMECARPLTQLKKLHASDVVLTSTGLEYLDGLASLRSIVLEGRNVTDAGLQGLKALTQVRELRLWTPNVTDNGLAHIRGLKRLELLNFCGTRVTDAGLVNLTSLTGLRKLYTGATDVTDAGRDKLQQYLPNCVIDR